MIRARQLVGSRESRLLYCLQGESYTFSEPEPAIPRKRHDVWWRTQARGGPDC